MKKKILCFLLVCILMVFAAACRTEQKDHNIEEETHVDLYWNVDRDVFVGDSTAGMNSRSPEADGFYSVRFALNGEQITYKVKKARLLEKIDSMDIMGLKIDDQGVITDVYAPEEITGGEVASMCYVVIASDDTITVSTDEALEKDYQFFEINEHTGIYNVTGMDPVGSKDVAITSDRIRAFVNADGVITHIFIVERYGYWAGETVSKQCEHCNQEVEFRVWEEKGALPTDSSHWILDNRVMLSAQQKIEANREIILDLNGYTVTGPDSKRVYALTGENTYLAILDSSEAGTGKIVASGCPDNGSVIYIRYGIFELFGGTIDASQIATQQYASAVRVNTDCVFNMYGGTIIGGKVVAPEDAEKAITNSGYGGTLYVSGIMNMHDGMITGGSCVESGGNIFVGKTGTLNLHGGQVTDGYAAKKGGNIAGTGKVNVYAATVSGGKAEIYGGNFFVGKGGLVTLEDGAALVSSGTAKQGGNIYIEKGAAVKANAGTLKLGQSSAHGGSIAVYGECDLGTCTVAGGNASEQGGNIFVGKTGTLRVSGATVKNGTAGTKGGNIAGTGKVNVYASTVSGGEAKAYGGNFFVGNSGLVTLEDGATLVSGGTAKQGGNIYIEKDAAVKINAGTLNLGQSSAHGGSIAVYGECDLGTCTVAGGNASEQGGNIFVGKTGTLRVSGATVKNGTAGTKGGNISGTGTVNLKAGNITDGEAVSYGGNIFSGNGATVTIGDDQVTVSEGTAKQGGNAYLEEGAEVTLTAGSIKNGYATAHGGAVAVYGKLNINAGVIEGSSAKEQGGNIFVGKAGTLNMKGGSIKNGVAGTKGGNIAGTGSINLQGGKILDGSAKDYGGNLFVSGTVNMSGGSIEGGKSVNGGGVAVNGAAYIMTGGVIKGGEATQDGGSVYIARNVDREGNTLSAGSFAMSAGEISGGTATRYGGNVFNGKECTFTLSGGKVLSGTSGEKGGNINLTGTVAIEGGTVSGGNSKNGGNINTAGTLEIRGGTIQDGTVSNTTKYDRNIFVEGGSITLSGGTVAGGVRIKKTTGTVLTGKANITNDQGFENLTLDAEITVSIGDLVKGAAIGINPKSSKFAIDAVESDVSYFTCDKKGWDVAYQDGKLVLEAGVVDWIATDSLPTKSGKYRLTAPVTVTQAASTDKEAQIYLDLNGQSVTGTNNTRIYVLNDGTTLTITDTSETPGKLLCTRESTADAGAIYMKGVRTQFNFEGGTIDASGVNVKTGAAVYVTAGATFHMTGGTITGGTATGNGGNIYVAAQTEFYGAGAFRMSGGIIENGHAATGGNVCALGVFSMTGGTITGGTATGNATGGNVYTTPGNKGCSFTMTGGTIGGLVRVNSSGSVILGGTAKISGGETNLTLSDKPARLETAGFSEGAEIFVNPEYDATASANKHFGIIGTAGDEQYIKLDADGELDVVDNKLYLKQEKPQDDVVDWSSGNSLPTESGRYRLTAPVTVSKATTTAKNAEIYLDLNGQTITGTNNTRIYVVDAGADLTIDDTATGGTIICVRENTTAVAGAIYLKGVQAVFNLESGTIDVSGVKVQQGAAVYVAANTTFNMNGGTITGGQAAETGGNIYVAAGTTAGVLNMHGGTVTGGKAKQGGNVYLAAGSTTNAAAVFNLYDGTVSGGEGTATAGNVAALGVFYMTGGEITGGICNVTGNHKYAANLYTLPGKNGCTFTMTGGTITGGVRVNHAGTITLGGTAKIAGGTTNLTFSAGTMETTGFAEGAEISVNHTAYGTQNSFGTIGTAGDEQYIKADDGSLVAVTEDHKLYLVARKIIRKIIKL